MKKKILFIFGTRPEAIKVAPVIKELEKYPDEFNPVVCVTGQHRQMLDQILNWFEIVPDYDLDIMKPGQDLFDITVNVLSKLKNIISEVSPDVVIAQGDTTTVMTASIASFYCKIPFAHLEAGLRTYDLYSPYPEEFNRKVAGITAKYHFAPTERAQNALLKEGMQKELIYITGNTVIDALYYSIEKLKENTEYKFPYKIDENKKIVLITAHRRESFGEGFDNICQAIKDLAKKYNDILFIYPVHLNPHVKKPVKKYLTGIENVLLIDPLDYHHFIYLMNRSYIILTDSGGVQEEAPSLGKPVLVMRDTTERPEAVEAGTVILVGNSRENIFNHVSNLLDDKKMYQEMSRSINPYGDGKASARIKEIFNK